MKIEFDRVEEFVACPTREPCAIRLRTAADRDGRLLARDAHVTIDGGAYTSWGSTTPYVMLSTVAGLYRVPNVRFDTTIAYTNNPIRARCAATATPSPRSRSSPRWTTWPTGWAWTGSRSGD